MGTWPVSLPPKTSSTELTYCQDCRDLFNKTEQLLPQLLMCETYSEVSEEGTEGAQNRPRQDVPHWHVDYFEVKAI